MSFSGEAENYAAAPPQTPTAWRGPWRRPARRVLQRLLARVQYGHLIVQLPDGERVEHRGTLPGPEAVFEIRRWRAVRRALLDGDVGFAEGYMAGDWTSPDVAALVELVAWHATGSGLGETLRGSWLLRVADRLRHRARANTRRGSKRNIPFHYDLGNDFYAAWLDGGMTYSSALYRHPGDTLEVAQTAKQDRAMELLDVQSGQRVLEIGCGWGGLAQRLVERCACHVTGLTLSPAQLDYASRRLQDAGLTGRTDLRLQDYRETAGRFDRIVSIEMLEAVGLRYWSTYFRVLHDRLVPGGTAVLQAITIHEDRFDAYCAAPDFIQKYIFPGGMLPTVTALQREVARAGLALVSSERFGDSYARTLAEWQQRFQSAWTALESRGGSATFKRMWEYYLAYSEGGFRAGAIDVGLYRITRPA